MLEALAAGTSGRLQYNVYPTIADSSVKERDSCQYRPAPASEPTYKKIKQQYSAPQGKKNHFMSSRAVRKALKQRELEEAQAKLASLGIDAAKLRAGDVAQGDGGGEEESGEEEEEEIQPIPRGKPNLFAMLGGDGDEEEEEGDEEENEEEAAKPTVQPTSAPISKSKKKKNKKKNKKKAPSEVEEEDEIDRALRLLNPQSPPSPSGTPQPESTTTTTIDTDLSTLLKIVPKNFDASQEMRRLFGRAAVDTPDEGGGGAGTPRGARRGAQRGGVAPGAQGGRGFVMKKGFFVQPKATWPNAGSGGLGMVVEGAQERCEFKFVHGTRYQDIQRQFMVCVMSMGMLSPL